MALLGSEYFKNGPRHMLFVEIDLVLLSTGLAEASRRSPSSFYCGLRRMFLRLDGF
jgi:hypothetical protein